MQKRILRRDVPAGDKLCDDPLLDRLYRSRHIKNANQLDRTLSAMHHPNLMSGMDTAVTFLLEAYQKQQKIVIVGDFDADGATSTALAVLALRQLGFANVTYLVRTVSSKVMG